MNHAMGSWGVGDGVGVGTVASVVGVEVGATTSGVGGGFGSDEGGGSGSGEGEGAGIVLCRWSCLRVHSSIFLQAPLGLSSLTNITDKKTTAKANMRKTRDFMLKGVRL